MNPKKAKEICRFCKGKGKVQGVYWAGEDNPIRAPIKNCPVCSGTGNQPFPDSGKEQYEIKYL